jgi:hypothetical protein
MDSSAKKLGVFSSSSLYFSFEAKLFKSLSIVGRHSESLLKNNCLIRKREFCRYYFFLETIISSEVGETYCHKNLPLFVIFKKINKKIIQ